jgi:hypothetical protein
LQIILDKYSAKPDCVQWSKSGAIVRLAVQKNGQENG